MLAKKIIGVWALQSWETVVDHNVVGYPLGEKAFGFIAYHPAGFMSFSDIEHVAIGIARVDGNAARVAGASTGQCE